MKTTSFKSGSEISALVFGATDASPGAGRMFRIRGEVGRRTSDGVEVISKSGTFWVSLGQVIDPSLEREKPRYEA